MARAAAADDHGFTPAHCAAAAWKGRGNHALRVLYELGAGAGDGNNSTLRVQLSRRHFVTE